jgi:hypothetical protein
MKANNNLIWIAILMLIMIIVTIIAIVAIVIMAFKIHMLIGIFVLCAIIYWICHRLMYII